ncbi:hypothetical protein M1M11_10625 [Pseudomonas azerbaijanoccidens]|jgi:hypothetical protein|uniref:Uncharacterized protein n=1 Tax=Pseudomonas fluorescens TaxID=294 RepID=A0A5E7CWH2_PSEFL|nr:MULTISPECIES: hypothetical protein [Pseudomonas]MCK8665336.1 hypothetical protein [Pseudomonas azerbaijanoccidentalis]VVO08966.1 hypothetical protein PS712_03299 [Pseudomonas fluorescens]
MIIGSRDLSVASWNKAAIHTSVVQKDSLFNLPSPVQFSQSGISGVSTTETSTTGSDDKKDFAEAFAKMMVNLRKASSKSEGAEGTDAALLPVATAQNHDTTLSTNSHEAAGNELATSPYQSPPSSEKAASELFKDYMNQTDAEKVREQLTGVSKEEYEKMSPEEQASLDKRVEELTKAKAREEQQAVKAKIDMVKAELA